MPSSRARRQGCRFPVASNIDAAQAAWPKPYSTSTLARPHSVPLASHDKAYLGRFRLALVNLDRRMSREVGDCPATGLVHKIPTQVIAMPADYRKAVRICQNVRFCGKSPYERAYSIRPACQKPARRASCITASGLPTFAPKRS